MLQARSDVQVLFNVLHTVKVERGSFVSCNISRPKAFSPLLITASPNYHLQIFFRFEVENKERKLKLDNSRP